jgi:hypothetical protein
VKIISSFQLSGGGADRFMAANEAVEKRPRKLLFHD